MANVEHEDALMKSRTSKKNVAAMIMMRDSRQATTTSFYLNGWKVRAGAWASFGSIWRWTSISLFFDEGVWLVVSCAGAVLIIALQSLLQPSVGFLERRIHRELSRPTAQYQLSAAIEEPRFLASDTEDLWSKSDKHELVIMVMCDPVTSVKRIRIPRVDDIVHDTSEEVQERKAAVNRNHAMVSNRFHWRAWIDGTMMLLVSWRFRW